MMMGTNVVSSFLLTWKIYISYWRQEWGQYERHVNEMSKRNFVQIPIAANLVWNVVGLSLLMAGVVHYAEFSEAFEQFAIVAVILPCLIGSIGFYLYLFGFAGLKRQLTVSSFMKWIYNFSSIQGMMLSALVQIAILYVIGLRLEVMLPTSCRGTILFPKEDHELALRVAAYNFWCLFAVLVPTLPLWQKGYQLSRNLANQKSAENPTNVISKTRIFMELLYQTCQANIILYTYTPICVIAQYRYGLQFHYIHLAMAITEAVLFNFLARFKFCIMHQLSHKIPALYNMTHIEHHICKTTHPTTPGAGLWEFWTGGGTILFATHCMLAIPYLVLTTYWGANLITHTMWPHPALIQWHTFHHTIQSDVYSVNIPSAYDKEHSKVYKKHGARFSEASLFMRHEALSDSVALITIITMGYVYHYGFGVGLGTLDWSNGFVSVEV